MSVDALDLDPDKLPAIPDPQVAGPAVDPAQAQAYSQAQAVAQSQGAIAKRPYIPDPAPIAAAPDPDPAPIAAAPDPAPAPNAAAPDPAPIAAAPDPIQAIAPAASVASPANPISAPPADKVNKPGAALARLARAARGTDAVSSTAASVASGSRTVAGLAQSTPAQMAGSAGAALLGGNIAEEVAHAANAATIASTALAQSDRGLQENFTKAQDVNDARMRGMKIANQAEAAAKSGMVGDIPIDTICNDKNKSENYSSDEISIAVQARMILKRNPNIAQDSRKVNRSAAGVSPLRSLLSAGIGNLKLGIAGAPIGAEMLPELTPEQTIGTVVAPELVDKGHIVPRESRPQNSTGDAISNFVSSLNPSSSRPIGNTTTLTGDEQREVDAHWGKVGDLNSVAEQNLSQRKAQEEAGELTGGYTKDEFARKTQLKEQISSLEAKAETEKSSRSRWFRRGPRFNDNEQAEFDQLGSTINSQDDLVKERQASAVAIHQAEIDKLEALKAEKLGQRSRNWRPWESGAYHFTDDEQKVHSDLQSKIDAITSASQGKKLTAEQESDLAKHREDMREMEQVRDTGLSRHERQRYSSLQTSIAATQQNSLFGLTDDDIVARHAAMSDRAEMSTTLETGLNKAERAQLQSAKAEREEQRLIKKTGLTKDQRTLKSQEETAAKDVYRSSAAKSTFLDEHAGKAVRTVPKGGPNGQDEHRIGGLKHENVTDEDTETTAGGWLAKAAMKVSGWISYLGEFMAGRSKDASARIDKNELLKASGITLTGGGMEAAAFAAPGVGGVTRRLIGAIGDGTKNVGRGGYALAKAAAKPQLQRDVQKDFTSGGRSEAVRRTAVDWYGANSHEDESSTAKEVALGLGGAALGAGSAFLNTSHGQDFKTEHLGKDPDPASLSHKEKVALDGKKAATGAVTDNALGIIKSPVWAYNALVNRTSDPTMSEQRDSTRINTSAEAHRAEQRDSQEQAAARATSNLKARDANIAARAQAQAPVSADPQIPAQAQAGPQATKPGDEPSQGFASRAWSYLSNLWGSTQDRSDPRPSADLQPDDMAGGTPPMDGAAPDIDGQAPLASTDPNDIDIDDLQLQ